MVKVPISTLLVLLCSATAQAQLSTELPVDVHDPQIEDRLAMAVVPTIWVAGKAQGYLPAEGFEARLVDVEHPETELAFPAGVWFFPPPGLYHVWAEGHGMVSPHPSRLSTGIADAHMVVRPDVVPGGRVAVSDAVAASGDELILLAATSEYRGSRPPYEMKRRRPAAEVGDGLMLPQGDAVAALWDAAAQRVVALSRPFRVIDETTVEAPLEVPRSTASLLVDLVRDFDLELDGRDVVEPRLRRGGEDLPPAVVIATQLHTYAAWYDLPTGPAVLAAHGERTALVPEALDLAPGRIEHRKLPMGPRRDLVVDLDLPAPLDREGATLSVRPLPQGTPLATVALPPATASHRFEGLVPTLAEVELRTSVGSFERRVDLRDAAVTYLTLDPDLISLWGTVALAGDGHAASLTFGTVGNQAVEVETDEAGAYQAALLEPLRSVEVRLTDAALGPWIDFYSPAIDHDRELDFDLPDSDGRVEVVDAATGDPVPAAKVMLRNEYQVHHEESGRDEDRAVAQRLAADADGVAQLPPLRKGRIELTAVADGYLPMSEPLHREVTDPAQDRFIRLALQPLGETVAVALRLADGTPAAGAEVLLTGSLDGRPALFSGRAGADGVVPVPRPPGAVVLLVRHPSAGGAVRAWPPAGDPGGVTWTLPPAAPRPLDLEVRTPSGEEPARQAELALWLDGFRLSGGALAWLTRSRPFTGPDGLWVGHNLPPRSVSVLAWSRQLHTEAASGSLDTLAREIPYPWASPATLRAVR